MTATDPPKSTRRSFRTTVNRIRSEPGLGRNVVIVLVLLVLAIVVGGIILGNQRFTPPWASRYVVNAAFEATPGVSPGNGQEVRVAGIVVGQIDAAEVGPDGKALLNLSMEPGTQIYDNASLVLRPKSPLNEMYVEIAPGGPPGAPVPSDGFLPVTNTKRPVQVDEVLGHLDGQARQGLTQLLAESDVALASAPQELPAGLDATASVTQNLAPVVTELNTRRDTLRRLVGALGDISGAVGSNDTRLTGLVDSLRTTLSALSENNAPLDRSLAQLPDLTGRLHDATSEVQGLADQLDPTLRNVQAASGDLPDALSRLEGTAGKLDSTIDVAQPVIREARPVVADLRPYVGDLNAALPPLQRITTDLDPLTGSLTDYLPDIGAFFVNTREIVSLRDANSGILRGILTANPETLLPPPANLPGTAGPIADDGQNPVQLPLPPGTEPGGGTNPAPETPGADAPGSGPLELPLVAPR